MAMAKLPDAVSNSIVAKEHVDVGTGGRAALEKEPETFQGARLKQV